MADKWIEIEIVKSDDEKENVTEKIILDGSITHKDKKLTTASTFSELVIYLKEAKGHKKLSPKSWVLELYKEGDNLKGADCLPKIFPEDETVDKRNACGLTIVCKYCTLEVFNALFALYSKIQSDLKGDDWKISTEVQTYYMYKYSNGTIEEANAQANANKDESKEDPNDKSIYRQYVSYMDIGPKRSKLSEAMREIMTKVDTVKTYEEVRDLLLEYYKKEIEMGTLDDENYSRWEPVGTSDRENKWHHYAWNEMREFEAEADFWKQLNTKANRKNLKPKDPNAVTINVPPIPEQKYITPEQLVLPKRPDMAKADPKDIRKYSELIRAKYVKFFNPTKEDLKAALKSWTEFKYAMFNNPLVLSSDVAVHAYSKMFHDSGRLLQLKYDLFPQSDDAKENLAKAGNAQAEKDKMYTMVRKLIDEGVKNKEKSLHPYLMYCASKDFYYHPPEAAKRRTQLCKEIFEDLSKFLGKMKETQKPLPKKEKEYAKWLLTWNWKGVSYDGADYFEKLNKIAVDLMDVLSKPLIEEYKKLESKNSPLIAIKLMDQYKCESTIKNNNDLLSFMWEKWFTHEKEDVTDDQLNSIITDYEHWGFCNNGKADDIKKHLLSLRVTTHMCAKQILETSAVIMDMINQAAAKVNPIFQETMKRLYQENLKQCDWLKNSNNKLDCGVFPGPIKTKARQQVKVEYDYKYEKPPRQGCVLDIVRCAIVCIDDIEMASLYKLIIKQFSKKILRVKNAFSDVKKANYGYRAVLINVICTAKVNGVEFPMIVEIQLILAKYFDVRKSMHLAYSVVRADNADTMAKDATKVGKLDI